MAKIAVVFSNKACDDFPVWPNVLLKVFALLEVNPSEENYTPPVAWMLRYVAASHGRLLNCFCSGATLHSHLFAATTPPFTQEAPQMDYGMSLRAEVPVCGITKQAQELLRTSPYKPIHRVACAYQDGMLVLRGRLRTFFHKQLAQEAVARVNGVRQVVNEIEVVQFAN